MAESLNKYFLQTSHMSPRKEAMKNEMLRLSTFDKFPLMDLSASKLSRAGFYFTGVSDEVQCFECDLKLKDWGAGLVPVDIHKKYSPNCFFINKITGTVNESSNTFQNIEEKKGTFTIDPIAQKVNSLFNESNPRDNVLFIAKREEPSFPSGMNESEYSGKRHTVLQHGFNFTDHPIGQENLNAHNLFDRPHGLNQQQQEFLAPKETAGNIEAESNISRYQQENGSIIFSKSEHENTADYRYEKDRLASFRNWPITSIIDPKELARSGFYYVGTDDKVQCTFCRGILSQWEPNDQPNIEHRKHFDKCAFLNNPFGVGNVPLENSQDNIFKPQENEMTSANLEPPVYQKFATSTERLASFTDFPRNLNQTPEQFADAGFFYSGQSDNVKCFHCDGGLRNWESNDIPWREHARWFPKCRYLMEIKGEDFIKDVQKQYAEPPRPPPPVSKGNMGKKLPVSPIKVEEYLDNRIVKAILDMGYKKNLIKQVIIRRMEQLGDNFFPNAESLLDAILEYEDDRHNSEPYDDEDIQQNDVMAQSPEPKKKNKKKKNKKKKNGDTVQPEIPNEPENVVGNLKPLQYVNDEEAKKLSQDIQRMKDERMCKICMDEEVNTVFLKCGHLVCCASCAPALRNCPICRDPIKGTVKIYLS